VEVKLRLGFDAKRAFFNRSGLGNYSRDTIRILSALHPENEYFLYSPKKPKGELFVQPGGTHLKLPELFLNSIFPSFWRSSGIIKDLKKDEIRLFHGLSNEIPVNIQKSGIKSVVSIHDLIFLTHPQYYKLIDRNIYRRKFLYACKNSDQIIAVSEKTKSDIIHYFGIREEKISVVYQGCNPLFYNSVGLQMKSAVTIKYELPSAYLLCVGTIEERKNQLAIVKSMQQSKIDIPLVLIGKSTPYCDEILKYLESENIRNVKILHNVSTEDLPAVYQMASVFVYPSLVEGFGIPVIEALASKIPVITSRGGAMEEAGGPGAMYVDPENIDELAIVIQKVLQDSVTREKLIGEGAKYISRFSDSVISENLMNVYKSIL
jgi:glycosyltransferase involved in cell wall biosynthesis